MGDPFQQVHDWEPGIAPSGLFWTVPFSPSAITVNPNTGVARLRARNVAVGDFHDFFNSIADPPSPAPVPSHVSFDVHWAGGGEQVPIHDDIFGFSGNFVGSDARITFTASDDNDSVVYRSDPDGQTSFGAGVGRERNGVYFA